MILAYIDPGAGSLLVQVVIAAVVSIPFFLRSQLSRIADLIRHGRSAARREKD